MTNEDKEKNANYSAAILKGMKQVVLWQINVKLYEEVGGPIRFLDCLHDALKQWGGLDPKAAENQRLLNTLFMGQSFEDIHKKLEKLDNL